MTYDELGKLPQLEHFRRTHAKRLQALYGKPAKDCTAIELLVVALLLHQCGSLCSH